MNKYDLIVIGGGPAGIAHAVAASRKGQRVKLVEARARLGGRLGAGEDWAGAPVPAFRAVATSGEVAALRATGLNTDDLGWRPTQHITAVGTGGDVLTLAAERAIAHRAVEARTPFEAERWDGLCAFLARASGATQSGPKDLGSNQKRNRTLPDGANDLIRAMDRPREELREVMRLAATPLRALLEDSLADDLLRAALAGPALFGGIAMPGSAGSAFLLADAPVLRGSEARLDLGFTREVAPGVSNLLMSFLRDAGIDFEIGVGAAALALTKGAVSGVTLSDGRTLEAPRVNSTLDIKATVLGLVDWKELPDPLVREGGALKLPGAIGRFVALMNEVPTEIAALGAGPLYLNTSPAVADHAANIWRMDRLADQVPAEVTFMRIANGKALMVALCHYLPLTPLGQAWLPAQAESILDRLCEAMEPLWPNAKDAISDWRFESPADLEARFGWSHGSPFGVEATIADRLGAGTGLETRVLAHLKGLSFGTPDRAPMRIRVGAPA